MEYLSGKELSNQIKEKVKEEVASLTRKPHMVVLVNPNDESSLGYVRMQEKAAVQLGIRFSLITMKDSEEEYIAKIKELNEDKDVDAIMVTRPLFKGADESLIINEINPSKDVDALNPLSLGELFICKEGYIAPATAQAIIELIKAYKIEVKGKEVLVVGRSISVGKPVSMMLLEMNGTVTIAHSRSLDLPTFLSRADIVIAAVGKPHLLDASACKEGAIVIDAGIHYLEDGIVGDVKPNDKLRAISKVPGGVGAITTACLMMNVLKCYRRNN